LSLNDPCYIQVHRIIYVCLYAPAHPLRQAWRGQCACCTLRLQHTKRPTRLPAQHAMELVGHCRRARNENTPMSTQIPAPPTRPARLQQPATQFAAVSSSLRQAQASSPPWGCSPAVPLFYGFPHPALTTPDPLFACIVPHHPQGPASSDIRCRLEQPGLPPPALVTMATRNPNLNNIAALKLAAAAAVAAADSGDAELRGPRGEWWWTGRKPWQCPGYDEKAGVLRWARRPRRRARRGAPGPSKGVQAARPHRWGHGIHGGAGVRVLLPQYGWEICFFSARRWPPRSAPSTKQRLQLPAPLTAAAPWAPPWLVPLRTHLPPPPWLGLLRAPQGAAAAEHGDQQQAAGAGLL
jgi:hypothetical protein